MASEACERCGQAAPRIESGPFAGSPSLLDYCEHCSKDLCETCMKEGRCRVSDDGKHKSSGEED